MGRTNDWLVWKPKASGEFTLTLTVPKHSDETLTDNNSMTAPISIREEKLRVLVVESYPRWEYRYLRNALSRDPGIELSCLLFHPGSEQSRRRQQGLYQSSSRTDWKSSRNSTSSFWVTWVWKTAS